MDLLLLISHYLMIASQCVSPFFFLLCFQETLCILLAIQNGCCCAVAWWQVTVSTLSSYTHRHVCICELKLHISPLRCRCRSGILHLWFLDPKNAAGGTSQYLCSNHGLSTSRPPCWSAPLFFISYHREGVIISPPSTSICSGDI